MFKSRKKACEEEAKKELEYDYVPTKDLKVDESNVTEEQKEEVKPHFPWVPVIVMGVIVILMIVCVIVIMCMGGPVSSGSSSI